MGRMSAILMVLVLLTGFGIGMGITFLWNHFNPDNQVQKPVINAHENAYTINKDSQVIFEQEYTRCKHIVISEYNQQEQLIGKTMSELNSVFRPSDGYRLNLEGETLTIRQRIDDWCPRDKNMYRLKEYHGRVAIYQGPDPDNDKLLRVTNLPVDALPKEVQDKIRTGSYEFTSEEALNDALENFDEYL
ncbi:MAG TPA: hypothetical protein PLM20_02060 [Syntrophomonadaceae bacterium]|nr:hypothetical protein [Syntrophomonadaceae bacterium]HQE22669.1 hypothetical protein [Syntrophomonadaceae bacterium]